MRFPQASFALLLAGALMGVAGARAEAARDARLIPVFKADRVWNGVTTTKDGRVFVVFAQAEGPGVQLAEIGADGTPRPFPDEAWNAWKPGQDAAQAFVHVNALRIGPDGALWVVDAGASGLGKKAVEGGARVLRVDLGTNRIEQIYSLAGAVRPTSFVDDVRFHGRRLYATDAGAPALIVLDLDTGVALRALENDPATVDARPMRADGKILRGEDGRELRVHADQLEVSPDGRFLYFQPASGPMARIETQALDDPALPAAALAQKVERNWLDTPTTGGTAIDAAGKLYVTDPDRRRILQVSPRGEVSTLIEDERLIWADALWIDEDGFLWIPATQLNLTPGFSGGAPSAVSYPVWIYKMRVDARPAPNDH